MPDPIPNCPQCAARMVRRNGKRGEFWGCTRYTKGCRGTRDIIAYPELDPATLAPGSPEQNDIWTWLASGTGNGLVEARAGTGKTYTITNGVYRLRGLKIAVFSFNNHIIKAMNMELKQKGITWVKGMTYNGFGFRSVMAAFPNVELFEEKLDAIITELHPADDEEGVIIRMGVERLVRLCKCYLEDGRDQEALHELVERFNIDFNGTTGDFDDEAYERRIETAFKLVPRALDLCLTRRTTIDYDDQVWWTVRLNLPVERFDLVLVDECQDTNEMQMKLVQMACPDR